MKPAMALLDTNLALLNEARNTAPISNVSSSSKHGDAAIPVPTGPYATSHGDMLSNGEFDPAQYSLGATSYSVQDILAVSPPDYNTMTGIGPDFRTFAYDTDWISPDVPYDSAGQ